MPQAAPEPPTPLAGLPPEVQARIATREYIELLNRAGAEHAMLAELQRWVEALFKDTPDAD